MESQKGNNMAWIESHSVLRNHKKVLMLSKMLKISAVQVIGHLHLLWYTAIEQQEDGDLTNWTNELIAELSGYSGNSDEFVKALQDVGWLDGKKIHDWWEYVGKFLQSKYSQNPEKWRTIKSNLMLTLCQAQPPNITLPNQTLPINTLCPTDFEKSVLAALEKCKVIKIDIQKIQRISSHWETTSKHINITEQIQRADAWLISNGRIKKNYVRFLTNWFNRSLDRGNYAGNKNIGTGKDNGKYTGGTGESSKYDKYE